MGCATQLVQVNKSILQLEPWNNAKTPTAAAQTTEVTLAIVSQDVRFSMEVCARFYLKCCNWPIQLLQQLQFTSAASVYHRNVAGIAERASGMVSATVTEDHDTARIVTQLLLEILPAQPAQLTYDSHETDRCKLATQANSSVSAHHGDVSFLKAREQAGCDLWDMMSSEGPAGQAVEHAALEILPKVIAEALRQEQTRLAEVLIGSMSNMLCHRMPAQLVRRPFCSQQHIHSKQALSSVLFSATATGLSTCISSPYIYVHYTHMQ